jgi:hypothetical protein
MTAGRAGLAGPHNTRRVGATYVRTTEVEKEGTKVYAVYSYVEDSAYQEDPQP